MGSAEEQFRRQLAVIDLLQQLVDTDEGRDAVNQLLRSRRESNGSLPGTPSRTTPFRDGNLSVASVLRLPGARPIDVEFIQMLGSMRSVGLSPGVCPSPTSRFY